MNDSRKRTTNRRARRSPVTRLASVLLALLLLLGAALAEGTPEDLPGGRLTIEEAGEYTLTGSMRGTVYVDPGEGDVKLILDNVSLFGGGGSGIVAVSGDSLTVELAEGSVNTVTECGDSDQWAAAIYSAVGLAIEGEGQLRVSENQCSGIRVDNAELTFNGGTVYIAGGSAGIVAEKGYTLNGGTLLALDGSAIQQPSEATEQKTVSVTFDEPVPQGSSVTLVNTETGEQISFNADADFQSAVISSPTMPEGDYQVVIDDEPAPEQPAEPEAPAEDGEQPGTAENPENPENPGQPGMPSGEQPGGNPPEMPAESSEDQQNGEARPGMPGMPFDGQQPGGNPPEMPAESTEDQQSGETRPGMPGMPFDGQQNGGERPERPAQPWNNQSGDAMPFKPGGMGGMPGGMGGVASTADAPSEIVTSTAENTAASLEADDENATTITMSDDNSQVKISSGGTYIVTGSSSDGSITVKKNTTGVVLVLADLDLTSTSGAPLSINKGAEVKLIISGSVVLTDAENPDDEESEDAEVADAFDGAAIKMKDGSNVYLTGDGTLTLNGSAKNGIKAGDDALLTVDGDVTIDITAANDGINANYDLNLLNGDITIDAGDDAIHTDRILTIGGDDGTGPSLTVTKSGESLEGTVVNIFGGDVSLKSSDDGINAANKDSAYEGELDYAINITGGDVTVNAGGDGLDSNGDINLIDGSVSIHSSSNGGEAGIDYDGQLYISDDFDLNNQSGVAGPDVMPGGMGGQMNGGMNGGQMNGQMGGQMPGGMKGGQMNGQMNGDMGGSEQQPEGQMNGGMGGGDRQRGGMGNR